MGEITLLLEKARAGTPEAWEQAVSLLYGELRRLAQRVHGRNGHQTLNATALVNECYLRLASKEAFGIESRTHFLAIAARTMRQILVNYARDQTTAKRGGGQIAITFDEDAIALQQEADDLLALNEALNTLAHEDARLVRIVDCRVFAGLSEAETASALDVPLRSVQRLWHEARTRLHVLLGDDHAPH